MDWPAHWVETQLLQVNTFSSRLINPADFPDEVFELYSVPSYPTQRPEVLKGSAIGSSKQTVSPGDVLVCKINPRINRVWVVGSAGPHRQIASSEWIAIRSQVLVSNFARHYCASPEFRERICADVTGVGGSLTRAQPTRVAGFPIPLPPMSEQKRIADKLDTLLPRIDACRERLDRLPALIKRFRQAVLNAAISGELSSDWRLSAGQGAEWASCTIEAVAQVGTGSTPLRSKAGFFASTGTPWITSAATRHDYITSAGEFVTEAAIKAHRLRLYPAGTILVAMYGEGKTRGQVAELAIEATVNQACAAVVVHETLAHRRFVKLMLQAHYVEMRRLAEGGNQPNLNLSKIKNFTIPLPPRTEQQEIVNRVDRLFLIAAMLQSRVETAHRTADGIAPSALAKAFRGELVPQDLSDEPAQVLLKRMSDAMPQQATRRSRATRRAAA